MNTLFRIAFGDYEFVLDRVNLTYSLTETVTKTRWASELSVGWIELKERATGTITRTEFSQCTLVSVSEKMGAAGKRILLGLDAPGGVPVDIYFICGPKEIQLTVEASRDSKTHTVEKIGLLPGLCRVVGEGSLVIPHGQGMLVSPQDSQWDDLAVSYPVWNTQSGLVMPFVGAVQGASALTLITDSAYAAAQLTKVDLNALCVDWSYERDPERRRLDLRIMLVPRGDFVAIARAYRDKLIGERAHITLRKKFRDAPNRECLLQSIQREPGDVLEAPFFSQSNRWEEMENRLEELQQISPTQAIAGDWAYSVADSILLTQHTYPNARSAPLLAVVYHDSVLFPHSLLTPRWPLPFLRGLLELAYPWLDTPTKGPHENAEAREFAAQILLELCRLTFPAFLTAHTFLTDDSLVEEALYSDKTYVVINQSETESYETSDLLLPPSGFYVRHVQFEAHDALRVGTVEFPKRAWRVRRSLDGKPLEQSEQVEERAFEVILSV